ncbi:cell division FtsA domain-containing protein, partial [Escherichia coli]|uniref:cell division FtsA domain-containing protein n=1 Tax=Escherichia coli TaxID=562 RepID=UPI00319DDDB2
ALRHTKVIPYAGNVVTSDIAYAFGTPPSDAEASKVRHGCALGSIVGKDESVEVPSVGGRPPRSLQLQYLFVDQVEQLGIARLDHLCQCLTLQTPWR